MTISKVLSLRIYDRRIGMGTIGRALLGFDVRRVGISDLAFEQGDTSCLCMCDGRHLR